MQRKLERSYKLSRKNQAERRALTMFSRAARTEGRNPPMSPIKREKRREETIIVGERAKENASSENELKLSVEIVKN